MTVHLALLRRQLAVLTIAFGFASAAQGVELNPAAVAYVTPDKLKWRDPANKGPNNNVILYGNPSKAGFYVQLQRWNRSHFSGPHFHPNDRFMMIFRGTWWNGTGSTRDPDGSIPMRIGTFVTHHAKGIHWDGAKADDADDAIFVIMGDGPGTATQVAPTPGRFSGLDPASVTFKTPDQFKWRDPTNAAPVNQTTLMGNPAAPGMYINLNRYRPGAYSRPHFHPNDGHVFVLKGTLWVGTSTKFDLNNTVAMPAGTYSTHFANQIHFQGAKDEEVLILVTGQGPATSTPAEEK